MENKTAFDLSEEEREKSRIKNLCIQCSLELLGLGAELEDQVSRHLFEKKDEGPELIVRSSERLKWMIEQIGWPTVAKVGDSSAKAACVIVLGSKHDFPFQESCLNLMMKEPPNQVPQRLLAHLIDLVRVIRGENQVYGTQVAEIGGKRVVLPIEDPANLQARRQEMGF